MHMEPDDDVEWLREMADDDFLDLFSEDESTIEAAVRRCIAQVLEDPGVEQRLVDLVDTGLDLGNDDTSASVWATVILGEAQSRYAVPLLLRCLASEEDETLQDAAGVALLRIGTPALAALMDAIDEGDDLRLNAPGYHLLGSVCLIDDEMLHRRVREFLESRIELERRSPASNTSLERLCQAVAYNGDKSQEEAIRSILVERYNGHNATIEDALALLQDNQSGEPIIPSTAPWEQRYGWLFDDDRDDARVERPGQMPGAAGGA